MTNAQTAMLERLMQDHGLGKWERDGRIVAIFIPHKKALAALRELLLAVQERDAKLCLRSRACPHYHGCHKQDELAIRAQTYADLFQEGKS